MNFFSSVRSLLLLLLALTGSASSFAQDNILTLSRAVSLAIENDPWILQAQHQEAALQAMAVASGTLPDPKVTVAMANLPTNTWDFDQEPMTQFKVGVSQMFPRGDQLQLKQKKMQILSGEWPYQRQDRQAKVKVNVSHLWLDGYKAYNSIRLIEKNRFLFEQMAEITQSNYGTALGRTRQQDVVRAQLELSRLEDRLTQLHQSKDVRQQQLMEWLQSRNQQSASHSSFEYFASFSWPSKLPEITAQTLMPEGESENQAIQSMAQQFSQHPAIKIFDQKILASQSEKNIAQQKYKPEWGLNASYGYRDDDPAGNDRADFFSVGVSFDVPFFTGNRQDKEVASAIEKTEALKTQKWQALRAMMASYQATLKKMQHLQQRQALFKKTLLPQLQEQAEASLTAYTNDDGDFAEVMRARIAQLNGEIEVLDITVERLKTVEQLNYFVVIAKHDEMTLQETDHE